MLKSFHSFDFEVALVLLAKFTSSHGRCSVNKDVLENFAKFTGKHLCQSLFLNKKLQIYQNYTLKQVFFCEFCKIFRNFDFIEHLWTTAFVSATYSFICLKIIWLRYFNHKEQATFLRKCDMTQTQSS